jgi:hypothetical protein
MFTALMRPAHPRCADVDAPNLRLGEALLQRRREPAPAAAEIENPLHLPVRGERRLLRHRQLMLLVIVEREQPVDVREPVQRHRAREFLAHLVARLDVNLVARVLRKCHAGVSLPRARPAPVRGR